MEAGNAFASVLGVQGSNIIENGLLKILFGTFKCTEYFFLAKTLEGVKRQLKFATYFFLDTVKDHIFLSTV